MGRCDDLVLHPQLSEVPLATEDLASLLPGILGAIVELADDGEEVGLVL